MLDRPNNFFGLWTDDSDTNKLKMYCGYIMSQCAVLPEEGTYSSGTQRETMCTLYRYTIIQIPIVYSLELTVAMPYILWNVMTGTADKLATDSHKRRYYKLLLYDTY